MRYTKTSNNLELVSVFCTKVVKYFHVSAKRNLERTYQENSLLRIWAANKSLLR